MSLKVLVCGDVDGQFEDLFERLAQVTKRAGPFTMMFVTGNYFAPNPPLHVPVPSPPIPTFILGPTTMAQVPLYPDINGCQITENLWYLGKSGVYNEATGLKIAYLSGRQYDGPNATKLPTHFNCEDVRNLQIRLTNEPDFKGVDILLTYPWPFGIEFGTILKPSPLPVTPSPLVSQLAQVIRPRYHFSAGGEDLNYERAPYRNHAVLQEQKTHHTRFVSLGRVANQRKTKWLYAFNISPLTVMPRDELVHEPPSLTSNPYSDLNLPGLESSLQSVSTPSASGDASSASSSATASSSNCAPKTASTSQFFYDTSYTGESSRGGGRGGGRGGFGGGRGGPHGGPKRHYDGSEDGAGGEKRARGPPGPCWFCLASPEVEKHLVVSIGEAAYVTLAKGGLNSDHLLILPIGHYGSLVECPPEVGAEIERFKGALVNYFGSVGKDVVFYERNFKSPHLQVQVVPIPKEKNVGLKITSLDFAESEGIEMAEFPKESALFQMTRPGFPYFYLQLPDGTKLFSGIKPNMNFPIQFGRELLASEPILNCPDKVDWKKVKMTKEEETTVTQEHRNKFRPFDFTLINNNN